MVHGFQHATFDETGGYMSTFMGQSIETRKPFGSGVLHLYQFMENHHIAGVLSTNLAIAPPLYHCLTGFGQGFQPETFLSSDGQLLVISPGY